MCFQPDRDAAAARSFSVDQLDDELAMGPSGGLSSPGTVPAFLR
jgi:hypothetical protein